MMTKKASKAIVMAMMIALFVAAAFAVSTSTASAATKKATKSVTVSASFNDDADMAVKVRLYKNGKATKKVATLSASNSYKASFKKLSKAHKWTVKPVEEIDGYHLSQKGTNKVSLSYHKMMTGHSYQTASNIF